MKGKTHEKPAISSVRSIGRDQQSSRGNRRLLAVIVLGSVLIAAAVVVRVWFTPPQPLAAVVQAADNASPEVAKLILEARDVVQQMSELYPDTVDTLDVIAMLQARFGDRDEATASWQRCLEIDPGIAKAHFELGLMAYETGKNAQASEHFRRATEIDSSLSDYPLYWAKSLTNEGKLDQAAEVLQADVARHPGSVASLTLLGDTCLQLNRLDDARRCYEQVVRMAPTVTSAFFGLGTTCSKLGDTDSAKRYLDRFKQLKAGDEQAHRNRLKDKGHDLARVQVSVAEVLVSAAKGFLVQNDPQTAENLLIRAREIGPGLGESWRVLAWLYERQSRIGEAIDTLRQYADQTTDQELASVLLGQLLARAGRMDEAETALRQAVQLAPSSVEAHVQLAKFYMQEKPDPKGAKSAATRAVELAPTADHYFLLASACHRAGDAEPALAAVERAIALAPDRSEYPRLRDEIRAGQGVK